MNALRILNQRSRKLVFVIIPFGITGSGKSTIKNKIEELASDLGWKFESVSSDEIRKEEMNKLLVKYPNMNKKDLFDKSGKDATRLF